MRFITVETMRSLIGRPLAGLRDEVGPILSRVNFEGCNLQVGLRIRDVPVMNALECRFEFEYLDIDLRTTNLCKTHHSMNIMTNSHNKRALKVNLETYEIPIKNQSGCNSIWSTPDFIVINRSA